jgi:hypothetical protein
LAQGSFCEIPKDFKKVKPLKERQELLKTNYELGSEKTPYETSVMFQFKDPKDQLGAIRQAKFKNYNKRIDIITGQILNNNYKASGYECFTENRQSRTSGDKPVWPADRVVSCPITGRHII